MATSTESKQITNQTLCFINLIDDNMEVKHWKDQRSKFYDFDWTSIQMRWDRIQGGR